ncbi:hypothetical protein OJ997_27960 [Solirubrobacter phytolaccae]|uniref:Uncharacterized protein n=1 Tax=Solirubrobacter phytolaccae TaxID=1404360 RepID=A0A9X3SC18_9ACTN|nr:hypothetical protein [Solirubrobacter phytolaccae]MDA0184176.1 hypothetical protein [Solirubrobacter phytolaccae]
MRRLLLGLAVVGVAVVAVLLLTSGGEDPKGETELGARGFPLRGSLAKDEKAIDSAVAEWREEAAEDEQEAEEDDDDDGESPETRERRARQPDPDDDVTVLWIGTVDDEQLAILESQGGLLAGLTRRESSDGWFVDAERVRTEGDYPGDVPIGVGDAILTPARNDWRFVDAGYGNGYEDVGDGLLWSNGGLDSDGFVVPTQAVSDRVPIYVTGEGGRYIRPEAYEAFTSALEGGYARAVFLATQAAAALLEDDEQQQRTDDEPPALTVTWTGEVPGYKRAAVVLHGDALSGRRAAALGYGNRPDRGEDKDERTVGLGTASADQVFKSADTFAAYAYTTFDNFPYLLLASSGVVDTVHALVGTEELRRKPGLAVIDARRFDPKETPDTVVFGRTAEGRVIAPLAQRR